MENFRFCRKKTKRQDALKLEMIIFFTYTMTKTKKKQQQQRQKSNQLKSEINE